MGTVSNKDYPDRPEVAIDHNGVGHDVKAFIYDAHGFQGVWTTDDRWIPENEIAEIEPKFPNPAHTRIWNDPDVKLERVDEVTCEGSAP